MEIKNKNLPKSRVRYEVDLTVTEVDEYFEHAAVHLAGSEKIPGFRQGKAPLKIVRERLPLEKLREEAYSLAVSGVWRNIVKDLKNMPIQDPEVEIGVFVEGKEAKFALEFDVRPEVKVKDWQGIKIKNAGEAKIEDQDVDNVINSLRQNAANFILKIEPAELGDKVEVSFDGFQNGVKKDKLSAKKFPLILGEGSVIPGFSEQLIGLKKNDKKEFELTFPKEHFDKELAGKKVKFYVTVDEIFKVIMPELDGEFAKKFGKDSAEDLRKSITSDLLSRKKDEQFTQQKAQWLSEFEKRVHVDMPQSLIDAEVGRSEQAWREFLEERHLVADDWLKSREVTLEKMREDWTKAATATVTVGLGIAEIAKEENQKLDSNEDFQKFVDGLVKTAIK